VESLRRYVMAAVKLSCGPTRGCRSSAGTGKTNDRGVCGPTFATTDQRAIRLLRQYGLRTRPIAEGNIPEHLRTFQGALQADAYAGFNQLL